MRIFSRYLLFVFMWLVICINAVFGQYVNLTGQLADTNEPRVLADASVVSIAYTMPRVSPSTLPPARLQSVLPVATVRLDVVGSADAPGVEWFTFTGFESWWSFGSPAQSPDDAHAWGSAVKGYSYGDAGSSGYVGAGMISTISSARMIDPRDVRELRAFIGSGNVTIFLNIRRVVHEFADGHWVHDFAISVEPVVPTISITFRYAEPGQVVYAHEVSAWGTEDWSWSQPKMHVPTQPGSSSVAFPVQESSVARIESPSLPAGNYYAVDVQMESRAYCTNGVENLGTDNAVCGGSAPIYGVVQAEHFAQPQYTMGYAVGVGSMQVGLLANDGSMDWRGTSGEWNASDGYSSYGFSWISAHGSQANALAASGFRGDMSVQGEANFVPQSQASRIAWSATAAMRARVRLVGRTIVGQ